MAFRKCSAPALSRAAGAASLQQFIEGAGSVGPERCAWLEHPAWDAVGVSCGLTLQQALALLGPHLEALADELGSWEALGERLGASLARPESSDAHR